MTESSRSNPDKGVTGVPGIPAGGGSLAFSGRVWLSLIALTLGGFAIGTTEFASMGLLPNFAHDLHMSIAQGGHAITAYAFGVVVGAPCVALFTTRLDRRTLLLLLMMFFALANGLSGAAQDSHVFLALRFLSGLPHGAYFGVAAVVASSLVPPARRGRAVAFVLFGLTVANLVGVPLSTYLGQQYGWRSLYVLVAVIALATVVSVLFLVPRVPSGEASLKRELSAFSRLGVWWTLAIGAIGTGGLFAAYTYVAPVVTDRAHMSPAMVPVALCVFGLGMTIGSVVGGRTAEWSLGASAMIGFVATAIVLTVYALTDTIPVMVFLSIFLLGFFTMVIGPSLQMILMDSAPNAPNLTASLHHSAFNMANGIGAFLGAAVLSAGYSLTAPTWVGVGLALLGALILGAKVVYQRGRARA